MLVFPPKFNARILYPIFEKKLARDILAKKRRVDDWMAMPLAQRREAQRTRLYELLQYAGTQVPYWKSLFSELNFKPGEVLNDPSALEQLPYLTKDIVRQEGSRMLPEARGRLIARRTGGSTGPSLSFFYDAEGMDWTAAFNLHVLEWAGKTLDKTEAHLSTQFPDTPPLKARWVEWLKCQAMNRTNIQTHSYDPAVLRGALLALCKARPYLLQGHPSTAYSLALFAERSGIDVGGSFQVFESTGEMIEEKKRNKIEETFGCTVFDRYGTAEFGVIAHETEASRPYRALRILDCSVYPELRATTEGCQEIVLTGLTNRGMPLIRYCQGDMADLSLEDDGWYFTRLRGRIHDMVPVGDSVLPTHYIQDMLDNRTMGAVEDFQIIMRPDALPELRLIVRDQSLHAEITRRIKSWWGDNMLVRFISSEELLHSGWRNKQRYLIWLDIPAESD